MAGYFSVTLDTLGPQGASVVINGDEEQTSSTQLNLKILCADSDTTGYQMKIWSDATEIHTEQLASWEDYVSEKTLTVERELVRNDTVTVFVKLRDDVWNESETVSDSIKVYVQSPVVNIVGISRVRISKVPASSDESFADRLFPKDTCIVSFTVDSDCDELKVMVADTVNAQIDDPFNVLIPTEGGSKITDSDAEITTSDDGMQIFSVQANGTYNAFIKGIDLETASPGDGIKIIKIFARSTNGFWSV